MRNYPENKAFWTKNGEQRLRIDGNSLPKVGECIEYIESCGYKYIMHCCGKYCFKHNETWKPISFTLRELRLARVYGW